MTRDKSGKKERWSEDRDKRREPKGSNREHGRERNIGHKEGEEHNRDTRRRK
jgi:hypothetical protein